jgi:hypothetical protein
MSVEQNNSQPVVKWVEELMDQVSELLSDSKVIKFNTHANRKSFIKKIRQLLAEKITANIPGSIDGRSGRGLTITRPNPNPTVGHTVMTEQMAMLADEAAKTAKDKLRQHNAPVRTW